MAFTLSTFGESSVKADATQVQAVENTANETATETEVATTKESSSTIVSNDVALGKNSTGTTQTAALEEQPESNEESNSFDLIMPSFDNNEQQSNTGETAQSAATSWEEAIKSVDKKAVAKNIGISDFALEMDEHIRNGGNAIDYLMARAIDYNKVSDVDLIKGDFDKKYSSLSAEDRSALFNDVYKQSEYDDDAQKAIGLIRMKADAHNLRQTKIAEQQSFKIPEPMQQQQVQQPNYGEQSEATKKYITENQATQAFLQSKRVAIPLGEKDSFNFSINDPNYLIKVMTDKELWTKHLTDKQGEPDINKMLRIAKYVVDPDAHDMHIYNYGQQKGERKKVEGNQYISKPTVKTGMPSNETLGQAFASRAKVSTYGNS